MEEFNSDEEKVKAFLAVGEMVVEAEDEVSLAALSAVTLAIFNLDESISLS